MRCKPGDLAVMVNSLFTENIGTFVEILQASDQRHPSGLSNIWLCRSLSAVSMRLPNGLVVRNHVGDVLHPDSWLHPIRPAPEQITRDEEIAA